MSDRSNFLGELANKMKEGISRINEEAKQQAARKAGHKPEAADEAAATDSAMNDPITEQAAQADDVIIEEVVDGQVQGNKSAPKHDEDPVLSDFEEGLVIDAEPIPAAPKKSGIDKKKLLVVGALVVAGAVFLGSQDEQISPEDIISQTTAGITIDENAQGIDGNAFSIDSMGSSEELGDTGFFGESTTDDDPNGAIVFDPAIPDADTYTEQAETEVLDPFTGSVSTTSASEFDLQTEQLEASPFGEFQEEILEAAAPAKQAEKVAPAVESPGISPSEGLDDLMLGTDESSLLSGFESNDTKSSGNESAEIAIKNGELQDQVPNADVASLKTEIALKDDRIRKLEAQAAEQAKALADEKAKAKAAEEASKKALAQTPATNSKPAPVAQQRSASQPQQAAPQRQATTRPQICISAIAQAARNCTTCVPHAFIVHKGQESMVGHGDFLEGLRVSIVGDRLDLQDSQGRVVHKFWSSPNACSAS